jgi:peptide/nickel transport system substrate-binding protein
MRFFLIASVLLLTNSAVAAGGKNPDVYTVLVGEEADSLDPAWSQDVASMAVILNLYERLFQFEGSSTNRLVPVLADKVPTRENGLISADGRTYVIPIRKGVKFHDGTPLTPEDVRYSILRFLLSDRTAGPSWLLLEPLIGRASTRDASGKILPTVWAEAERAVSIENGSLVLRLPRPFAPLLSILASRAPVVVSKRWAIENKDWDGSAETWERFNDRPKQDSPFFQRVNGTGPFKLQRWDRTTKEILLARNDGYWRAPAKLKAVVIRSVGEFGTRKLMLQAGDADAIAGGRSQQTQLRDLPGVRVIDDLPVLVTQAVFFTYDVSAAANPYIGSGKLDGEGIPRDFFADKNVRGAFASALDVGAVVSEVLQGKGARSTGCIPKGLLGHDDAGPTRPFDLKAAESHFRKAHLGKVWDVGFKLTYTSYSGDALGAVIGQILKRNIERLNPKFKIDLRVLEWPTFLDARNAGKLPLYMSAWTAKYPDPHDFAFAFLHSRGLYPSTQKFKSTEFDELIEEAKAAGSPADRSRLYSRLQRMESAEIPHLLIADVVLYRTEREWVKGWVHNPIFPNAPYEGDFYPLSKE